jgi:Lon protease-like protein
LAETLPLFPLKTVLLPGGPLSLRVFEVRYLDMVARCLRGTNRFGVVAIRHGNEVGDAEFYDAGTTAEIIDWQQQTGGMLGILAVGRERFRVESTTRQADGLYTASVAVLPAPSWTRLPEVYAPLAAVLRERISDEPVYRSIPVRYDDAVWVADRLVETLPLPLAVKQSLLEIVDPLARLDNLQGLLRGQAG